MPLCLRFNPTTIDTVICNLLSYLRAYNGRMLDGPFDVSALDDLFADLPKTLTPEQAGDLFGVSVVTVRKLITNHEGDDPLPAIKFGKAWVILRDDFKLWLIRRSNASN